MKGDKEDRVLEVEGVVEKIVVYDDSGAEDDPDGNYGGGGQPGPGRCWCRLVLLD
jgi:hypothetical protein